MLSLIKTVTKVKWYLFFFLLFVVLLLTTNIKIKEIVLNRPSFYEIIFFSLLRLQEDTIYAEGYNAKQFNKIKTGMTTDEVISIIGYPLSKFTEQNGYVIWIYSKQGVDTSSYRIRDITINKENRVHKIIKDIYID